MRALALVLALLGVSGAARAQDGFVTTSGTGFTASGAPFSFVGANVAVMHGPVHRAAMEATLDAAAADGLRVVRLWALGEYEPGAPSWADDYAFRRGPDVFLDRTLEHLDRVLAACAARDLRAIVVLGNRWADYGGLGAYLRWALVPFSTDGAGAVLRSDLAHFYRSDAARALYRAHVERVVGRTSSVTGVPYRDDPTIFAWELVNELESSRRDAPALVGWVESEAAFVRSLDPRHLVSAGHIGYSGAADRRTWREVAGAAGIDFLDAHAYPTRYGEVQTLEDLSRWIDDRAQLAHHVVHRPLVFGEVGFTTTSPRVFGIARHRWLDGFLRAAARDGVAGVLAWIYVPDGDVPAEHAILTSGEHASRTLDLRRVLARYADRWARSAPIERNPSLGDEVGETALWDPRRTVLVGGGVHDDWERDGEVRTLSIDPAALDRARFEHLGRDATGFVEHVWASGEGWARYRFRTPRTPAGAVEISFRASSELPGPGLGATPADVSTVHVRLDGLEAGSVEVPVDDGVGREVSLSVSDPAILAALAARRVHTLELWLDADALGVCLYGGPGPRASELPSEVLSALPGRLRLRWAPIPTEGGAPDESGGSVAR